MREIKFRAWDKTTKEMSKTFDLEHGDSYVHGWDNEIVMQYTGLKDKNGKEIYEGDILRVQFAEGLSIGEVSYDKSSARFRWRNESIVFSMDPKYFEVIGNIYEKENEK